MCSRHASSAISGGQPVPLAMAACAVTTCKSAKPPNQPESVSQTCTHLYVHVATVPPAVQGHAQLLVNTRVKAAWLASLSLE